MRNPQRTCTGYDASMTPICFNTRLTEVTVSSLDCDGLERPIVSLYLWCVMQNLWCIRRIRLAIKAALRPKPILYCIAHPLSHHRFASYGISLPNFSAQISSPAFVGWKRRIESLHDTCPTTEHQCAEPHSSASTASDDHLWREGRFSRYNTCKCCLSAGQPADNTGIAYNRCATSGRAATNSLDGDQVMSIRSKKFDAQLCTILARVGACASILTWIRNKPNQRRSDRHKTPSVRDGWHHNGRQSGTGKTGILE